MMDMRFDLKRGRGTYWFQPGSLLQSLAPNQIVCDVSRHMREELR